MASNVQSSLFSSIVAAAHESLEASPAAFDGPVSGWVGVFFVIDPPLLFWGFYKVMKIFASQATLDKVKFVTSKGKSCTAGATGRMHPDLAANFEADQLEEDYGGTLTSKWDAEAYFAEEDRLAVVAVTVVVSVAVLVLVLLAWVMGHGRPLQRNVNRRKSIRSFISEI